MSETRRLFFAEAQDLLAQVQTLAATLTDDEPSKPNLNRIFRYIHSIKGGAAAFGFKQAAEIAHRLEDLLAQLRRESVTIEQNHVDLILQAKEHLAAVLFHNQSGTTVERSGLHPMIAKLDASAEQVKPPPSPAPTCYQIELVNPEQFKHWADLQVQLSALGQIAVKKATHEHRIFTLSTTTDKKGILAVCSFIVDPKDIAIRVAPLSMGELLAHFPAMIDELNQQLGKSAVLIRYGDDIEIDKDLAKHLLLPITHIVRNCMAHGIESPARRKLAGKPDQGRLTITSAIIGSNLSIRIADNGEGLNRERILTQAYALGLPLQDDDTDESVWQVLFDPRFSTAAETSTLAGRGVGLDIVKTALHELDGQIQITSRLGVGTTMTLLVPVNV